MDAGYLKDPGSKISRLKILRFATLSTQSQTIHYLVIALDVRAFKVIEQASSLRDHLKQTAPRMVVFLVKLKMLSKFVNPLAEQSDLHLGRSGVCVVHPEFRNNGFLCLFC